MRKLEVFLVIFCIIFFATIWWFWEREPYILLAGGFSDPGLVYVEPKWNGWHESAVTYMTKVPAEFREGYPQAKGWWYAKRQIADIPDDLIKLDEPMEKSLQKMEKYYAWQPLGIKK